ncbi:colicin V family bacteriocin [Escherichia coli]|nr:colicin V family bacteriocin [Escherichia coli]
MREITLNEMNNVSGAGDVNWVDVGGNDSNLLIVFYVQIMPDDLVMQLHRF